MFQCATLQMNYLTLFNCFVFLFNFRQTLKWQWADFLFRFNILVRFYGIFIGFISAINHVEWELARV